MRSDQNKNYTYALHLQEMGSQTAAGAGNSGRMAEGASHLVVSRAHLQLTGHHGANAGGRQALHQGRQNLEGYHEAGDCGT